ncbi:hypothetical protein Noda2021_08280 [Candidatus Dependentiae bacterium Noda2021]|nr:hypothetical protein Noda2021_08280 [Candidatus Dependentiae bacterium Noda2021]
MKKCIKIVINSTLPEAFVAKHIQKNAKNFELEGLAHKLTDHVKIVVCGMKDNIDQFTDMLHKELSKIKIHETIIEPFVKDKDYRGVFRILE